MKTHFLIFFLAVIVLSSCMKSKLDEVDSSVDPFSYRTVKEVVVKSESGSNTDMIDVFNQEGDTIAVNIPSGTSLLVANSDVLTIKTTKSPVSQLSKSATRAGASGSTVYFPSKTTYATLMFEDEYPYRGDYDMNDVVVGFRIEYDLDEASNLTSMYVHVKPYAVGSTKEKIGLALMFCGNGVDIQAEVLTKSMLLPIFNESLTNGLEPLTSKTKSVVPLTGNLRAEFVDQLTGMINTFKGAAKQNIGKTITTEIIFKNTIHNSDVTFFGANPSKKVNIDLFAIFNERSNEVHVKGMQASDRFDDSRFINQKHLPNTTNLFCDKDNYIWAIMTPKYIPHPTELTNIVNVYSYFQDWVNSGGKSNTDWYNTYSLDPNLTFVVEEAHLK